MRKAHREYTSKIEEWLGKLHCATDAVILGHEEAAETVSEERKWLIVLSHLHALPLNAYQNFSISLGKPIANWIIPGHGRVFRNPRKG
jgi:hypothetical protein